MTRAGQKGIIAIGVLVLLGGFGTYLRGHRTEPDRPPDFGRIPLEIEDYYGTEEQFETYAYDILKADTTTLRMYRHNTGDIFWLFVAYFSSQKYGSQIHSPKHCLPGGGYKIISIEPYDISFPNGRTLAVNRLLIADRRQMDLMFYWFETRSGVISHEYGLKFDLMKNSVLLLPTDAAICRVTMPLLLNEDFEAASARAVDFLHKLYPSFQSALPFEK